MAKIEVILPSLGEGIIEATLIKWLKKSGEVVSVDEPIAEIATDKVDTEVVSSAAGVINKFLFNENDAIPIGAVIALVENEQAEGSLPVETENHSMPELTQKLESIETAIDNIHKVGNRTSKGIFISPLVRSIANIESISQQDLENISGTGIGNRITRDDIYKYINNRKEKNTTEAPEPQKEKINIQDDSLVEIIEMDRVRKKIAEHMVHSKQVSPHVTSFIEVDVTGLVLWREKIKDDFLRKHNEKLTYTPIFIDAIAQAIKDFPMINISVDGTKIIRKKFINIGMATALPDGNLIVPVIKNVQELNLLGITKQVNLLAEKARKNKLTLEQIQGGTFTLTNLGSFGNLTGTPIINQPEVAILATGTIKKKPAVIETPTGDTIGIRHILILSLSYDHRVVDGALGGMFLKKIADLLENYNTTRIF